MGAPPFDRADIGHGARFRRCPMRVSTPRSILAGMAALVSLAISSPTPPAAAGMAATEASATAGIAAMAMAATGTAAGGLSRLGLCRLGLSLVGLGLSVRLGSGRFLCR